MLYTFYPWQTLLHHHIRRCPYQIYQIAKLNTYSYSCCFLCWVLFVCLFFCGVFVFVSRLLCPMLTAFLDCPFLISPSVFSNVYSHVPAKQIIALINKIYTWKPEAILSKFKSRNGGNQIWIIKKCKRLVRDFNYGLYLSIF